MDKAQFDELFHKTDSDKDGFVSGTEIKGIFLKSGLPQAVLAKIWFVINVFVDVYLCFIVLYMLFIFGLYSVLAN